eukprot:311805-Chlamydomonas_euryale.AAC.4
MQLWHAFAVAHDGRGNAGRSHATAPPPKQLTTQLCQHVPISVEALFALAGGESFVPKVVQPRARRELGATGSAEVELEVAQADGTQVVQVARKAASPAAAIGA